MYGDFKEGQPDSLDQLSAMLNRHAAQAGESSAPWTGPSQRGVIAPPSALTRGEPSGSRPSRASRRLSNDSGSFGQGNSFSTISLNPITKIYLEICTRQNTFDQKLGEIDTSGANTDGVLFQLIQAKYQETTRATQSLGKDARSWLQFLGFSGCLSLMRPTGAAFVKVFRCNFPINYARNIIL